MKCDFCGIRAGLLRRTCFICAKVIAVIDKTGGQVGLAELVDIFAGEGLTREQVDRVLDAEIGDRPTIRDRLTSNMVNSLMRGLGMPGRQSPEDVRKVRSAAATAHEPDEAHGTSAAPGSWQNRI
ncbi:MAG: hypothetical protein ABSD31_02930 [Candidatus Binataceae bacterium]|jgi:hypothetical protein